MSLELLLFATFDIIAIGCIIYLISKRLDAQDNYITSYIKNLNPKAPKLKTKTEIKPERKPQSYSPKKDIDYVMSGKVVDPFD